MNDTCHVCLLMPATHDGIYCNCCRRQIAAVAEATSWSSLPPPDLALVLSVPPAYLAHFRALCRAHGCTCAVPRLEHGPSMCEHEERFSLVLASHEPSCRVARVLVSAAN